MRGIRTLTTVALSALLMTLGSANAAFTVITGTGAVTVAGTSPNTTATSGTGLVSTTNYLSWSVTGAEGAVVGGATNSIAGLTTSSGTPIAAVYLVSNGANAALPGVPATLPVSGSSNLQRRNSEFPSYLTNFTAGEPLLFANAASAGLIIDFAVPVQAAGFRVSQESPTFRDDFFIAAFTGDLTNGFSPVPLTPPGSGDNLFVDATVPGVNSAPFYGIAGGSSSETFTRIFLGFSGSQLSGPAIPFAIGTLEVIAPGGVPPQPNPVPVPPTVFAAGLGALGLAALRRVRR